jgi:hypothetical protein
MKLRQYITQLYNSLKNIANQQGINEEWGSIKTAIIESVKETIQFQEKPPTNEWWVEEC